MATTFFLLTWKSRFARSVIVMWLVLETGSCARSESQGFSWFGGIGGARLYDVQFKIRETVTLKNGHFCYVA